MNGNVYFDSFLKKRNGDRIPYYDISFNVSSCEDQKLVWFHEGYGTMRLYRLHQIDDTKDFIAEPLKRTCWTSDPEWDSYLENPELALETV